MAKPTDERIKANQQDTEEQREQRDPRHPRQQQQPQQPQPDSTKKTAANPSQPTKQATKDISQRQAAHNPAQGTPSIRRNPEAGKPQEKRRSGET